MTIADIAEELEDMGFCVVAYTDCKDMHRGTLPPGIKHPTIRIEEGIGYVQDLVLNVINRTYLKYCGFAISTTSVWDEDGVIQGTVLDLVFIGFGPDLNKYVRAAYA